MMIKADQVLCWMKKPGMTIPQEGTAGLHLAVLFSTKRVWNGIHFSLTSFFAACNLPLRKLKTDKNLDALFSLFLFMFSLFCCTKFNYPNRINEIRRSQHMILIIPSKDILKIFPCCRVICATISAPALIAQTGHTCNRKLKKWDDIVFSLGIDKLYEKWERTFWQVINEEIVAKQ